MDKADAIAKFQAKQAKEQAELQKQLEIIELLPDNCPDNYSVHVYNLYGRIASIKFDSPYDNELLTLEQLPTLLKLFPALPIVKTAKGSTFSSFLPEVNTGNYNSSVTGWDNAGFYLFSLQYSHHRLRSSDCELIWFTQLGDYIIEIKINLDAIAHNMIQYENLKPRATVNTMWSYSISDRFSSLVSYQRFWSDTKGRNPVTIYCPDGLDPYQMFYF